MKRALLLLCAVLLIAGIAVAQEAPKAEVFGGYSYMRSEGLNINGWNASVTGNLTKNFGITSDFSGHYKNSANMYNFLFGPQVSASFKTVKPFAHALFGANRLGGSATNLALGGSDTAFAMAFGGGVDVKLNKNFGVRLGQADYLYIHHLSDTQNSFRFSTGVVFGF